ncbi:MAG TPA: ROK family protein [Candidatus Limnocylindria bacterium]|nr:ROK family protein [Candidatus Limnocylindria bacterium]
MAIGALEAGGTKMSLGVFTSRLRRTAALTIPTATPDETVPRIAAFFREHAVTSLGIAAFGPVDVRRGTPGYGTILNTPKLAWRRYPLLQALRDELDIPIALDTDVNAAALAEVTQGAAKGLKNCLYLTVGTGIGGGLVSEGSLVHGLMHPEWGHLLLPRHPDDPMLNGVCPFHASCAEGFASGPAMQARWGMAAADLPADHRGWDMEAWYLAHLCMNAVMAVSPEVILLGGGVLHAPQLLPLVRSHLERLMGGYVDPELLPAMDDYVRSPALYPDSGLVGAALLGRGAKA